MTRGRGTWRFTLFSIAALAVLVAGGFQARQGLTTAEEDVFRWANELPSSWELPLETVMQLGTLGAVAVVAAAAFLVGWQRAAGAVAVCGVAAWGAARMLKILVERDRPMELLDGVVLRSATPSGFAYPSGHTAVAAGIVAALTPFLNVWQRVIAWTLVIVVALARMYVGAHLPLDVLGGIALGALIGTVFFLLFRGPSYGARP